MPIAITQEQLAMGRGSALGDAVAGLLGAARSAGLAEDPAVRGLPGEQVR